MAASAKRLEAGDLTSTQHRHPGIENLRTPWQPGQSGNPAGRPRGARSKLSELALTKLLADFELHGDGVIEEVRKKAPANYLAAIVSLLPKQQEKLESPFADLTAEELDLLETFLKSQRATAQPNIISVDATRLPSDEVDTSPTTNDTAITSQQPLSPERIT